MTEGSWIVRPCPPGATDHRLVCIPYAGGGVATFRGWAERLPSSELAIVQLPGRGARAMEPPTTSLEESADRAVAALTQYGRRPTALFGHSLGAVLAFEMARRLRDRDWPLTCLVVSGRPAPTIPDRHGPISHLPFREFVAKVQSRYSAIPAAIRRDPELLELLIPGLRADIGMLERYWYQPGEPLPCPIVAFGGLEDPHATTSDLQAWSRETSGRYALHLLPGGHFFLQSARDELTTLLRQELAACSRPIASCA